MAKNLKKKKNVQSQSTGGNKSRGTSALVSRPNTRPNRGARQSRSGPSSTQKQQTSTTTSTVLSGSEFITSIIVGEEKDGSILYKGPITPAAFPGTRLNAMSKMWSRFHFLDFAVKVTSRAPPIVGGSYTVAFLSDLTQVNALCTSSGDCLSRMLHSVGAQSRPWTQGGLFRRPPAPKVNSEKIISTELLSNDTTEGVFAIVQDDFSHHCTGSLGTATCKWSMMVEITYKVRFTTLAMDASVCDVSGLSKLLNICGLQPSTTTNPSFTTIVPGNSTGSSTRPSTTTGRPSTTTTPQLTTTTTCPPSTTCPPPDPVTRAIYDAVMKFAPTATAKTIELLFHPKKLLKVNFPIGNSTENFPYGVQEMVSKGIFPLSIKYDSNQIPPGGIYELKHTAIGLTYDRKHIGEGGGQGILRSIRAAGDNTHLNLYEGVKFGQEAILERMGADSTVTTVGAAMSSSLLLDGIGGRLHRLGPGKSYTHFLIINPPKIFARIPFDSEVRPDITNTNTAEGIVVPVMFFKNLPAAQAASTILTQYYINSVGADSGINIAGKIAGFTATEFINKFQPLTFTTVYDEEYKQATWVKQQEIFRALIAETPTMTEKQRNDLSFKMLGSSQAQDRTSFDINRFPMDTRMMRLGFTQFIDMDAVLVYVEPRAMYRSFFNYDNTLGLKRSSSKSDPFELIFGLPPPVSLPPMDLSAATNTTSIPTPVPRG